MGTTAACQSATASGPTQPEHMDEAEAELSTAYPFDPEAKNAHIWFGMASTYWHITAHLVHAVCTQGPLRYSIRGIRPPHQPEEFKLHRWLWGFQI